MLLHVLALGVLDRQRIGLGTAHIVVVRVRLGLEADRLVALRSRERVP